MTKNSLFQKCPSPNIKKMHSAVVVMTVKVPTIEGKSILIMISEVLDYSLDWNKVRRVAARICRALQSGDRMKIAESPEAKDFRNADWLIAVVSMTETVQYIKNIATHPLVPVVLDGLLRVSGRMTAHSMTIHTGHESLILLSPDSRLAKLVMIFAHRQDHRQSNLDAWYRAKSLGFWIIHGRKLSKTIAKSCILCKQMSAKPVGQQMGKLPEIKYAVPCKPFSHIGVDYLGPMEVVDTVKRRVKLKVWPIVFVCLNTGAVHCQLATAYSTDKFLDQYAMFTSIRGQPRYVFSDQGTNLTKAKEMTAKGMVSDKSKDDADWKAELSKVDWNEIKSSTAQYGTEWHYAPSYSQWRDGASEACVKMLKRTLHHMTKGGNLTYDELLCLLFRASNVLNERPIGMRHHQGAEPGYCPLTPNLMLMTTRTETGDPMLGVDDSQKFAKRFAFIQNCFEEWWRNWYDQVFDSLVPMAKWRQKERNLAKGDIILVKNDPKDAPGVYRYGVVLEVHPDTQGLVRTATVGMRPRDAREKSLPYLAKDLWQSKVSAQRIVVILPVDHDKEAVASDKVHRCADSEPQIGPSTLTNVPIPTAVAPMPNS